MIACGRLVRDVRKLGFLVAGGTGNFRVTVLCAATCRVHAPRLLPCLRCRVGDSYSAYVSLAPLLTSETTGASADRYVAGPSPPNTGSTISIVPMHRRGVVCNGIDDLWGLLRWRRIGMRLSEVCAQGRRSPTGAHTLGRVPRGSVTVRMYMSTPLWMREGTSLSPPLLLVLFCCVGRWLTLHI